MMEFTRRKFLRLAPASVGAIALGAAVLPQLAPIEHRTPGSVLIAASQRAVDPPFLALSPSRWEKTINPPLQVGDLVMFDDKTHVVKWT